MAAQRYRLLGAWRGDEPLALAGYRLDENLIYGSFLYVDDLVTHESSRGRNLGARLLDALTESARRAGCAKLVLDTGLSNALAQRLFPPGPADQRHALLQAPGTGDAAMNRILHLDCSPRLEGSESARLSRAIVDRLVRQHPGARVIGRPLRQGTIAHVDGDYARALAPQGGRRPGARLAGRFRDLDTRAGIRRLPGHRHAHAQLHGALGAKAWIDHVVRANRTFTHIPTGKLGVLADRPVYVAVSSGGSFASEPARQPDFLTPYLTAILNTIGLRTIHLSVQRAAAGGDTLAHARSRAQAELERHFAAVHA